MLFFIGLYWVLSVSYCLRWHYKNGNLNYRTFFIDLLIGPAAALIIVDEDQHTKRFREHMEDLEKQGNENRRRFSQFHNRIRGGAISARGFHSIPPPPPLSRIERAQTERENAIRSALERIEPPNRRANNKDFKFFQK